MIVFPLTVRSAAAGVAWSAIITLAACGAPVLDTRQMSPEQLVEAARESCRPKLVPDDIPSLQDLADSTRLVRAIGAATFARVSDSIVLSLVFDEEGELSSVGTVSSSLGEPYDERVREVTSNHVKRMEPGDPWGIRLIVETGPNPTMKLERSTYCGARLDRSSLRGPRSDVRLADREMVQSVFRSASDYRAAVSVDALGRVQSVQLGRMSGIVVDNPIIAQEIRAWRFLPALLDGIAISSRVTIDGNGLVGAASWFF